MQQTLMYIIYMTDVLHRCILLIAKFLFCTLNNFVNHVGTLAALSFKEVQI